MYTNQENRKIKIAIIVPSLLKKGPVIVADNIIYGLADKFCFELFYFDSLFEIIPRCPFFRITNFKIDYFSKFDIIHSHGLRPDLFNNKVKNNFPQVVSISTIHNFIFEDLNSIYGFFLSLIFGKYWVYSLRKIDKIVTLTQIQSLYYSKYLSSKKIFIIENSILLHEKIDINLNIKINQFKSKFKDFNILGTTCQLIKRKGVIQLLQSLYYLEKYILIIVGDGPELISLIKESKKIGVYERILFTGFHKNNFILFRHIDIFLLPSLSEGYPLSLIEATKKLIPTVCSDLPIFKEILPDDIRFTFKLYNIDELTNKIIFVNQNKLNIKEKIRIHLNNNFLNFDNMINKYQSLYCQ